MSTRAVDSDNTRLLRLQQVDVCFDMRPHLAIMGGLCPSATCQCATERVGYRLYRPIQLRNVSTIVGFKTMTSMRDVPLSTHGR